MHRWQEHAAFRATWRREHPRRFVHYPSELSNFPPFAEWLTSTVKEEERCGCPVEDDVKQYAQPPEQNPTSHCQMYCHGMHLRVQSSEGGLVTSDSGVVACFARQLCWGLVNGRLVETNQEYVGYIEEILVLDYRNHCVTVLLCDWVKDTQDTQFPTIQGDKYDFSLANFNQMDGKVHANSFAFPLHCLQVFFSDDPHHHGWKVVCRTKVRGRRTTLLLLQSTPQMVQLLNDNKFVGLQPLELVVDSPIVPPRRQ